MDGDDRVLPVVLAAEHLLDLAGLHFGIERVERLREFGVHGLSALCPFDQHDEIVALLRERRDQVAVLPQTPAALLDLLRLGLVFPEVRRRRAGVETGQFLVGACGLKDSSADRQRVR
jgi:hypothetical protein